MPRNIRIDDQVWSWLQTHARPLADTPNSVLRRMAGLDEAVGPVSRSSARAIVKHSLKPRPPVTEPDSPLPLRDRFPSKLEEICRNRKMQVSPWAGKGTTGKGRRGQNILRVQSGNKSILLYFKISDWRGPDGFWGVTPNRLLALRQSRLPWFLVLLRGPQERGYLGQANDVQRAIDENRWSCAQDGEYKVHEQRELEDFKPYDNYADLIADVIAAV